MKKFSLLLGISFVLFALQVSAELPVGLQKIIEYNQQQAQFYLQNVTIFVVFLAGLLSFLAPCTLAIVPAFFSVTFREKGKALPMALAFFLGFSFTFMSLGLVASALGHTLASFQMNYDYLVVIAGFMLVIFGLMSIFNKGFAFIRMPMKLNPNFFGVFLMGVLFAIGWSACVGPILSGVLLIASLASYSKAAVLMLFYSLGNFIPFIVLSSLMDKYNLLNNKWISGKEFKLNLFGREMLFHTTTLISGILLVILGSLFLIYGNTAVINAFDPFKLKPVEEGLQRGLLGFDYAWAIALLVLAIALGIVWYSRHKK